MNKNQTIDNQEIVVDDEEVEKLKQSLPKLESFMGNKAQLVKYQGLWCTDRTLKNIIMFQTHFQARDTDFIIASHPKTGTTWLKSLLFSVVNRKNYTPNNNPLLMHSPHELVYSVENTDAHKLNELPSPRLFQTHLLYACLPDSIKTSKSRLLYITRNPFDTFVSQCKFYPKVVKRMIGEDFVDPSIELMFEDFYEGRIPYGPFFEHVLEYWHKSLEGSNKVLFLKYEDLKGNPIFELKRLAAFVGYPFSDQEENEGVINEIIELCSINKLKGLEVNKNGVIGKIFEKNDFFRKGEIGDWVNYFTPSMFDRLNRLMEEKFNNSGLSFKITS